MAVRPDLLLTRIARVGVVRPPLQFRHVKGQVSKRELWYADVQGDVSGEANPIAVSAKFVAVAWRATGGGR
jgi:hypothetical protein